MKTTQTRQTYSHGDSHLGLSDSIHGRRHEGRAKSNLLGDLGFQGRDMGREVNVAGEDQEVIVGQAAAQLFIEQGVDREAVAAGVLLQGGSSLGRVKVCLRHGV